MSDSYFKSSDQVLVVQHDLIVSRWDSARRYTYVFDFEFRMMTVVTDYERAKEAIAVHPFPALDPDVLQKMHDKLVEMGGSPTPLGPVPHAKGAFAAPSPFHKPDGGLKL
ncbi:MAG: hypothetical protein ACAH83_06480 [Alphaproteobacteria bacterium]